MCTIGPVRTTAKSLIGIILKALKNANGLDISSANSAGASSSVSFGIRHANVGSRAFMQTR